MEIGSLKYPENTEQVIVLLLLLGKKSHSSTEEINPIGQSYGKKVSPTMKLDEMPEDRDQYVAVLSMLKSCCFIEQTCRTTAEIHMHFISNRTHGKIKPA